MADEKKPVSASETATAQGAAAESPEAGATATIATAKPKPARKPAAKKVIASSDDTSKPVAKTTAASSLESVGKKILAAHPRQTEVYVISNGRAFFNLADAANAARGLENKTVTTVKR